MCNGSGWGVLKELERSRAKQSPLSRFCIFPSETLSEKQKPFIGLLENGVFPVVNSYYIINTAVTYELEVPSAEDFRRRIEKTLKKYPYIVAERDGRTLLYWE